jgi:WD40 repeat protein
MVQPTAGQPLSTLDMRTVSEASAQPAILPSAFPEVNGYEILGVVREGGMGIVYKAWQVAVDRPVALKMIRAGEKATTKNIDRFHREAQAIGQLQHPNIVQLYEHGEAEGRPFFSMEYLEGGSLSDRFRDRPQSPRRAAQLVQVLADAVHFCHQHGVVHRDLKPSNVLLTEAPGSKTSGSSQRLAKTPNAAGTDTSASETFDVALWTAKLSDFGLVKQLGEDSGQTLTTDVIGTPSYMAPEQTPGTSGSDRRMGAETDVYGLGAILYWALTGSPPFRGASVLETLEQVRNKEPVAPSQLHLNVPLDLETICLKCLQKVPARRYSTAQALSKDLGNFLQGREIVARPVSRLEKAKRWCRRNPGLAAAISAAVFFLAAGSGGSLFYAAKANDKAAEAIRNEAEARDNLAKAEAATREAKSATELSERRRYGVEMHLAYAAWKDGRISLVKQWLEAQKPKKVGEPDLRGFESRYLEQLCYLDLRTLRGHGTWLRCVAFSPDGRLVASGSEDHEILIWNSADGQLIRSLPESGLSVSSLAFSPDGRYLVSATDDPGIKLWDVLAWKRVRTMEGHTNRVKAVAFSPNGKHIVSGSADRTLRVWDRATGKEVYSRHTGGSSIRSIAFSPAGNRLATTSPDGTIRIWETELWKEILKVEGHGTEVASAAFSPDGKLLVTASENTLTIWDAESLKERQTLHGHTGSVHSVAFSPDGERVASAGKDFTVRTWSVSPGAPLLTLRGHESDVFGVTFSPDGRRLASASGDGTVKIWDSANSEEFSSLRGHTRRRRTGQVGGDMSVTRVQYSPDGRWLASGGEDHMIRIWEPSAENEVRTLQGHKGAVRGLAFSPDSKLLASASEDGTIRTWDVETGKEGKVLNGHVDGVSSVAFVPDGRSLASAGKDKTVRLWDLAGDNQNRVLTGHEEEIRTVAISPDGLALASGSGDGIIKVWDPKTCKEVRSFRAHGDVRSVAFSPDGERIASVGDDLTVKVWSTSAAGEPLLSLPGHLCQLSNVEFSADGRRIISVSRCDLAVRIWDALSGQELITLPSPYGLEHVVMSPDNMQLTGAAGDGTLKIWNAYPMTAKRAIQREARSDVAFLFNQRLSEAGVLSRIHADVTISDEVKHEAMALAKPYGRNLIEFEAHRLVGTLLAEPITRSQAIARLRADKTTWAPVRDRALVLVQDYPEDTQALFAAALVTVVNAGANASQYDLALEQANTVCGLKPDDPYSICILGIAQYRAKCSKNAIETLNRAGQPYCIEKVDPKDRGYFSVLRLAFSAMAQHDMGNAKEAQEMLLRLREAMKQPMPYGQDRIAASVSGEAEKLLRTTDGAILPRKAVSVHAER